MRSVQKQFINSATNGLNSDHTYLGLYNCPMLSSKSKLVNRYVLSVATQNLKNWKKRFLLFTRFRLDGSHGSPWGPERIQHKHHSKPLPRFSIVLFICPTEFELLYQINILFGKWLLFKKNHLLRNNLYQKYKTWHTRSFKKLI